MNKQKPALLFVLLILAIAALISVSFATSIISSVVFTIAALYLTGLLLTLLLLMALWASLPVERKRYYAVHRMRFCTLCVSVLVSAGALCLAANRLLLPGAFERTSLMADGLILLFAPISLWVLAAARRRIVVLVPSLVVLLVALMFLSLAGNAALQTRDAAILRNLATLPYLTTAPDDGVEVTADNSGVVYYDSTRASDGINIYNPRTEHAAYLMDMSGNILHTWMRKVPGAIPWMFVEMLPTGDLLAIVKERMLIRLDWDSNLVWKLDIGAHHDLSVDEDGTIAVIATEGDHFRTLGLPIQMRDDLITFVSPEGEILDRISLGALLRDRIPASHALMQYLWYLDPRNLTDIIAGDLGSAVFDLLHTNTVEIIDRDVDAVFARGNMLFCVRNLDIIGVVNPTTRELVWTWGPGVLQGPHHPTLLDNGHLLVFDNGTRRGYSRVIELVPATGEIVWEYEADPPADFYSASRGANQRLPNGNTLVTQSDVGRCFETTPDGLIVWEFFNPESVEGRRAVIYRLMRFPDTMDYPSLRDLR